jgi:hypothetical protein
MYQTRSPIVSMPLAGSMAAPSYHFEESYGMYTPYGIGANLGYPVPAEVYLNNGSTIPWNSDQSWGVSTGIQQYDILEDGQVYDNSMEGSSLLFSSFLILFYRYFYNYFFP